MTVLFTFIDEGQRSIAKFERFLSTHDKLLCSLPAFEVVYVALTPELFKEAQHLFGRLFPARPATHPKKLLVIGGQTSPTIPKAESIVELVQDRYPSLLESDPVCDAVWLRKRVAEQKSLFSSEMPNEAVWQKFEKGGNDPPSAPRSATALVVPALWLLRANQNTIEIGSV